MVNIRSLHPGDRIRCAGWHGVVVFNNVTGEYGTGFDAELQGRLGPGFMVHYDEAGLVFQAEVDEDVMLADG